MYWGGGINPTKSTKTLGFKPLIATSLALALIQTVVMAQPTITIGGNDAGISDLQWKNAGEDYYQFSTDGSTVPDNNQIWVGYTSSTNTASNYNSNGNLNLITESSGESGTSNYSVINGNSSGLKIGETGEGTLSISQWRGTSPKRLLTLDLSNATSTYALLGNLKVFTDDSNGGNTLDAKFGSGGIKGSVTLNSTGTANLFFVGQNSALNGDLTIQHNGSYSLSFEKTSGGNVTGSVTFNNGSGSGTATTTFKNLAAVSGGITISQGSHTINFQDSNGATTSVPTLTANITASGGTTTINNLSNLSGNIYFTGGNTTFNGSSITTGTIFAKRGATSKDDNHKIVFNTTNSVVEKITQVQGAQQYHHLANIYFNGENSEVRRIEGIDPVNASDVTANIFATFNSSTSNRITGDITAQGGYSITTNNIIFTNENAQNTILGNITVGKKATNTITSDYGLTIGDDNYTYSILANTSNSGAEDGTNTISASNLVMQINRVYADNTKYVSFSGGTRSNSITATTTGNIHIKEVSTGSSNATAMGTAQNTINITAGTLQIDALTAAFGNNNITSGAATTLTTITANDEGNNTIVINNSGTLNTTSISAIGGENNITTSGTENITIGSISSNGNGYARNASNTLSIDSSGTNQITGAIAANSITLSSGGTYRGTNTITFSNTSATNTLSGSITASGGTNTISFAGTANKITKSITSSAGTNSITTGNGISLAIGDDTYTEGSTTQIIEATGGGTARNIISAGNLTLNIATLSATLNGQPTTNNQNIIGNYTAAANGQPESITGLTTGTIHIGTVSTSSGNNSRTGTAKNTISLLAGTLTIDNLTASCGDNVITSGATTTISNVSADRGTNTITTTGNGNTTITNITSKTNNIQAATVENNISIGSSGTNGIAGAILAEAMAYEGFNVAGTNTISFSGSGSNTISASITANAYGSAVGQNNITFGYTPPAQDSRDTVSTLAGGDPTSSITGAITATGGTNTIAFNSGSGASSITSNIAANGGTNTITFSSSTSNTLGNNSSTITANGGNNNITFSGTSNTFAGTSISIGGNGSNTFNIQENTSVTSDLSASRTAGSGKNIFNISNEKSLTFANGGSATTLTTTSGATEINFLGDNGGNSIGTFSGNITTSGGTTTIAFAQDGGTYTIADSNTFTTSGEGKNIIDLSTKNATISNDLNFTGSSVASGSGNIINIGASKTLTLSDATPTAKTINTASGITNINFNGSGAKLSSNVSTSSSGTTTFNLGSNVADTTTTEFVATITGTLTNSVADTDKGQIFNIKAKNATLQYSAAVAGDNDGLTFSAGNNIINFENTSSSGATLNWKNNPADGTASALAITTTGGTTTINFNQDGVIAGGVDTNSSSNGSTTIAIANGKNGVIQGAVTTGATNSTTTINFANGDSAKRLTLNEANNTITNITFRDSTSTNNTLALTNGKTTINNATGVSVGANQGINFDLAGGTEIEFTHNFANSGGNATFNLAGASKVTGNLTTNTADTANTLIEVIDGANAIINGIVTTSDDANTTINFAEGDTETILSLTGANNTISTLSLTNASTNNTLDLSSTTSLGIANPIALEDNQSLVVKLRDTALTLGDGSSKITTLNVTGGDSGDASSTLKGGGVALATLNLNATGNASLTLQNSSTIINALNANGITSNALVLDATTNAVSATINNVNASNLEIRLNGTSTANTATLNIGSGTHSFGVLSLGTNSQYNTLINSGNLTITDFNSEENSALSIGGSGTTTLNTAIDSTALGNGGTLELTLSSGTLVAKEGMDNTDATINLALGSTSTLVLDKSSTISSLVSSNGAMVDVSKMGVDAKARGGTNNFVINSYKGDAGFVIDTVGGMSDTIIFESVASKDGSNKSSATIYVRDSYDNVVDNPSNSLVAQVKDGGYNSADGSTTNMHLIGGKQLMGASVVEIELTQKEENGVVNYYLAKGKDEGSPIQYQEIASSALTVNYDLYLANLNSINKRMGELRNTQGNNGVWARVFGGTMSNDFGAGSKTDYVTAQAGYDYSLSVGNNARNFTGIALAYGTSDTKGNSLSMNGLVGAGDSISLDKVNSNMVEVGLYNSYVADSGWYNDTIFKFDYIMSEFSLSNDPNTMSSTSNFAMVLSDEFGYRYGFGENEKGSWYIDPQAEFAFGYFNQSDFNRVMYDAVGTSTTMQATQDSILTLRTRVGASLGKKFNTEKGFASLYVGAFYEYDYIEGGNASMQGAVNGTTTTLDSIESNGRAVLNVGSNIELTKGARLYIDVEKSFGDKQRTFMQFNLGARYSF